MLKASPQQHLGITLVCILLFFAIKDDFHLVAQFLFLLYNTSILTDNLVLVHLVEKEIYVNLQEA